jgi:hypothetical protein
VLAHPDGPALLAEMAAIKARHSEDCPSVQILRQRLTRDPRYADLAAFHLHLVMHPDTPARLSSLDGSS